MRVCAHVCVCVVVGIKNLSVTSRMIFANTGNPLKTANRKQVGQQQQRKTENPTPFACFKNDYFLYYLCLYFSLFFLTLRAVIMTLGSRHCSPFVCVYISSF